MKSKHNFRLFYKLFSAAVILLIACSMCTSVQAAVTKKQAISAYKSYLAKQSSSKVFALLYINNDSVPELAFGDKIFTYTSKGMVDTKYNYYFPTRYYKKKCIVVGSFGHGNIAGAYQANYYFKWSKSKLAVILCKDEDTPRGEKTIITYRTATGKKITASAFNKVLKKYVGSTKPVSITKRLNTAANRNKYLK